MYTLKIKKIFFKIFGVVFNGDCAMYDRYIWLKKNLVVLNENSNFLDIGCGNGWSLFVARKIGFKNILGLSWNKEDLDRIYSRTSLLKNIKLLEGDARKLDEINFNIKFDAIVNSENIEHILNSEKLISNISKILNTGGLLYLTTPNLLYPKIYGEKNIKNPPKEDGGHVVRGYSRERLKIILNKYNLKIINTNYIGGKFNISLLNFERYFPFRIRKILTIPLTVIFNYLDNIFFKDNKNNLSIAIIAEKIDDL